MEKPMSTSLPTMPNTPNGGSIKEGKKKKSMSNLMSENRGVKAGNLRRKGYFGQWKEAYFSLEAGNLIEFKDSKAKKAERAVRLKEFTVQPADTITGQPLSIALMNSADNKTIFLAASTHKDFREWISAFKANCKLSTFEQNLEITMKAMTDAAILADSDGIILTINQPAIELFGYTREEVAGKDIKMLMPKDYADKHDSYMIRFKTTNEKRLIGKPRQLPVLRKGGTVVLVELSLGEVSEETADNRVTRFLATMRKFDMPRTESKYNFRDSFNNSNNNSVPNLADAGKLPSAGELRRDSEIESEVDKSLHLIVDTVAKVTSEELRKSARKAAHYRSRYLKLKKKNTKLKAEVVSIATDLRSLHRAAQVSSIAFYQSISDAEADNEYDIVKYLKTVITTEINECQSPGTLFRDERTTTKRIAAFFLFQGAPYVIKTLSKIVQDICIDETANYEIDPRLDATVSEDEIKQRVAKITDGLVQILSEIKTSVKECPTSFGSIFRHIKIEISKKFLPSHLDPYTIMSSFFFLRLIIPAIVQPKRYNLINDLRSITPNAKRGLMLISKILISIANGIIFHEKYMEVFNDLVFKNSQTLHNIFDDIMLVADQPSNPSDETHSPALSEDELSDNTATASHLSIKA
eukprot:TRINITY_DN12181_c0_g1_i3.p1 TRINITY_DN12181_c0_g1~~TRINITY_DN12181_c0_g1_i3.p1  ORF type:complete len:638 (+),score=216.15 TRINITY_DN12181_c0_g1_i3:278-2191(+)